MSNTVYIIVLVLLVAGSAFFSATEMAFSSVNMTKLKLMANDGNKKAKLVCDLLDEYDKLLSTILIGNNIVNIAMSSIATVMFVKMLGDGGATISTVVVTVVVLIFGEISPKSIAKDYPEKITMGAATAIHALIVILTPVNFLFTQWKKLLSHLFHAQEDRSITEEELLTIVDEVEQAGGIDQQEGTLIRSAIEFSELEARDVLTPRVDITAVSLDTPKEEIAKIFAQTGFSRIPVYQGTIDHILGILYQKDFHNHVYHTDQEISSIIRPALYIAEGKLIGELLQDLQKQKSHIAVVLDEFGGTVGIVTMEDILEELVGEIWDEHDEVVEEIQPISDREYVVMGTANVQKLLERLNVDQEPDAVSVSGWVVDEMGHMPVKGDSFDCWNLHVSVLEMNDRRVQKIKVCVEEPSDTVAT